jgi:hypothetical protein
LPEVFSTDVGTVGGATGNLVNKTIVVPNKRPVKDAATIDPGIRILFIFCHIFMI